MSCCANYEPTRSAMQTSICQKRPISEFHIFAPQNAAPWKVPPEANAPSPPPAATGAVIFVIAQLS